MHNLPTTPAMRCPDPAAMLPQGRSPGPVSVFDSSSAASPPPRLLDLFLFPGLGDVGALPLPAFASFAARLLFRALRTCSARTFGKILVAPLSTLCRAFDVRRHVLREWRRLVSSLFSAASWLRTCPWLLQAPRGAAFPFPLPVTFHLDGLRESAWA